VSCCFGLPGQKRRKSKQTLIRNYLTQTKKWYLQCGWAGGNKTWFKGLQNEREENVEMLIQDNIEDD
jgi:hypothetical protein